MKSKILITIVLSITASLLIGCNPKKEEPSPTEPVADKEQIKAELQTKETAFAEAINQRNVANLDYYADGATSFSQNKPAIVGKEAINKSLSEDLAEFPKGNKISFTTNETFPSKDGKIVLEIGSYKVVDSTNAIVNTGNYMSLFEKRDGKYVCIRDMSTSDMPKEEK